MGGTDQLLALIAAQQMTTNMLLLEQFSCEDVDVERYISEMGAQTEALKATVKEIVKNNGK